MDILYISDNNYIGVLRTSIISLFENNQSIENIRVFLIGSKVSSKNRDTLIQVFERYNRRLYYIEMPDIEARVSASINTKNYNLAKYSMCFISAILPEDIQKILYLDCDTLVRHSLEELWNTDVSGVVIGAIDDVKSKWHKRSIGLGDDLPYINAGVMLVNLSNWSKHNVEENSIKMLEQYGGSIPHREQGILNFVIGENKKLVHPKFNLQTAQLIFSYRQMLLYRKPKSCFSSAVHTEAVADPVIVHFTNNLFMQARPWLTKCTHPYAQEYLRYSDLIPLQDAQALAACSETTVQQAARAFYKIAPHGFVAWVGGFLQAYIAPMKDCMMNRRKRRINGHGKH